MRGIRLGAGGLALLVLAQGCQPVGAAGAGEARARAVEPDAVRAAVSCNNGFGLELLRRHHGQPGNLLLSPASLSPTLALVLGGARNATRTQMQEALRCAVEPLDLLRTWRQLTDELIAANGARTRTSMHAALWRQSSYSFLPEYLGLGEQAGAEMREADFVADAPSATHTINGWVSDATSGQVRQLLPEGALTDLTRLVIVSTVLFRGAWHQPFDPDSTHAGPFTTSDGAAVQVRFMAGVRNLPYAAPEGLQVLELPYDGERLSMLIALPGPDRTLRDVVDALSPQSLASWVDAMRETKVAVYLPRFRIESSGSLRPALKAMGMTDAFSIRDADLSGMTGNRDLYLEDVVAASSIDVDEEGTVAAAAGGAVVSERSMPVEVRADRPFLFLIRDRTTGLILFAGELNRPDSSG